MASSPARTSAATQLRPFSSALCVKRIMKKYIVKLDERRIGTTNLEKADAPMGVVFGVIDFEGIDNPYQFISNYFKTNNIPVNENDPETEAIFTQTIDSLTVFNEKGVEIKGIGSGISGFKEEGYEIEILGIPYPFYEEEFPHHREAYDNQYN